MNCVYYFVLLTSSDKLYLPIEIRKHILSFINIHIVCITCSDIIIISKHNLKYHYNGYPNVNHNCICNKCKKIYNITI